MRICLYGASSNEIDPKYIEQTEQFGRLLASRGHSLVYGGGAKGLMGAAARGVYEKNGEIIGIAPTFFAEVVVTHESNHLFLSLICSVKNLSNN